MLYRKDIDGLRAIAVIAVLIFHLDERWLAGGFLGVDVFFVISGFLITGVLYRGYKDDTFSAVEFYRRRVRRIIPVMTLVIFATLLVGHYLLTPPDLRGLSWSALASQFSVANIYYTYTLDTGYFADDASLKPLLHMWSLGVEEQFYLFWPIILLLLHRFFSWRNIVCLLVLLALVSIAFSQAILVENPVFAYFMLPARAGQLLVGAIAYFISLRFPPQAMPAVVSSTVSTLSLVVLVICLLLVEKSWGVPGVVALPACLSAAALLYFGGINCNLVSRLLSFRPVIFVGLISYSLYLWHWPVISFLRYVVGDPTVVQLALAAALSFVLAVTSYYFVEQPLRRSALPFKPLLIRQFVLPSAVLLMLSTALIKTDGLGTYIWDDEYLHVLDRNVVGDRAGRLPDVCQRPLVDAAMLSESNCLFGKEGEVLLWGDSNAAHYVSVIKEIAMLKGFSFRNVAHSACPPILERPERFARGKYVETCKLSSENVQDVWRDYKIVVLAARWKHSNPDYLAGLKATVKTLEQEGKRVVLLGVIPRVNFADSSCLLKNAKLSFLECSQGGESRTSLDSKNNVIRELAVANGAEYLDFSDFLCDSVSCSALLDGRYVYYDAGHLSYAGGQVLGQAALGDLKVVDFFSSFK